MEPPMATVTCSDGSEWTKWHPPDTLDSVTHSSCLIMISLWLTSATQSNVITKTETMIQDQPPQQTKTGSLVWGPRRLRGAQLTKQASLLSSSREPRADGQWPPCQPLDTSDTVWLLGRTKFLLFSRIYLLLWNTDGVFSVSQSGYQSS